jgi:hypothetical protein
MSSRPKSFKVNKLFSQIMPPIVPVNSRGEAIASHNKKYKKKTIPKALKEQVWMQKAGHVFEIKCPITWCENHINAFNFHTGHNIPESKGGKTSIENLIPICDRCNTSMGDRFSIDEWNKLGPGQASAHVSAHASAHASAQYQAKAPWWICCSH